MDWYSRKLGYAPLLALVVLFFSPSHIPENLPWVNQEQNLQLPVNLMAYDLHLNSHIPDRNINFKFAYTLTSLSLSYSHSLTHFGGVSSFIIIHMCIVKLFPPRLKCWVQEESRVINFKDLCHPLWHKFTIVTINTWISGHSIEQQNQTFLSSNDPF